MNSDDGKEKGKRKRKRTDDKESDVVGLVR
jgi:hypothetical protein